jgi:DinB superfamily
VGLDYTGLREHHLPFNIGHERRRHRQSSGGLIIWGPQIYGDPCRECGYDWSITSEDCIRMVLGSPARLAHLLEPADALVRHPDLSWNVAAYSAHIGDNLRIWAERLAGLALGADRLVAGYDSDLLAAVRSYGQLDLRSVLWSLERAADDWNVAVAMAASCDRTLVHPERGELTVDDVVHSNSHDVTHHEWDIARSLQFRSE